MGVLMQAFYWDCPRGDGREFDWWNYIRSKIPSLAATGFTCLWLPPVHKAANLGGPSMGYDPYDYYDLGEFDQKGGKRTWYGSKQELLDLITSPTTESRFADMVINHNLEPMHWRYSHFRPGTMLSFQPKSSKQALDAFHQYEPWDENTFGDMPIFRIAILMFSVKLFSSPAG
jgi:alpha-amylase